MRRRSDKALYRPNEKTARKPPGNPNLENVSERDPASGLKLLFRGEASTMAFKKGQSGNPQGRPHGSASLREVVRRRFKHNAAELIDALSLIALGSAEDVEKALGAKPTASDRQKAIAELLERGWEKSVQRVELFDASASKGRPSRSASELLGVAQHPATH